MSQAPTAGVLDPRLDPLGLRARALFSDLAHAGELCGPGVLRGEAGSTDVGARVRFYLQLSDNHTRRLRQVRYRAYGCPFTLAACEWLARELVGRVLGTGTPAEALRSAVGTPLDWVERLGIPSPRLGRLLVIEDALRICCAAAYELWQLQQSADESVTDSG